MERLSAPVRTEHLRAWVLALIDLEQVEDDERIEQLRVLEELKCAAAGAQARIAVELDESQRAAQRAAGVRAQDVGKGVAAQVALARREAPHRGARLLGLAHALQELPHTARALSRGEVSEWRATMVAQETACVS